MEDIQFSYLSKIDEKEIIDLMNNDLVRKHLPLLTSEFSTEMCRGFIKVKMKLWDEHGYGPWAFLINGKFAGWGGLQEENGEADFALVLHPSYWGWGRRIFNKVIEEAFTKMNLTSITALLPPNRPNSKAILRMGFVEEGDLSIDGENFLKFRLSKPL